MVDFTKNREVIKLVQLSIEEDINQGDPTSESIFQSSSKGDFSLILKEDAVVCGLQLFEYVFKKVDPKVKFSSNILEVFQNPGEIGIIEGSIKSILNAERTALNFIQRMSGVATETYHLVKLIEDLPVEIIDTRKTIPGWRVLDKYSVFIGGGRNHRMNLGDAILLKDNHLKRISITEAVKKSRQKHSSLKIEAEVENWNQLREVVNTDLDIIMLDNWNLADVAQAITYIRSSAIDSVKIELSGGISKYNLREYAETRPDYISVGYITHSARSIDFSLEMI